MAAEDSNLSQLKQMVMADREITEAHQKEIYLEVLQSKIKDKEQTEATRKLVDMAVRAGRIQGVQVIGRMANVIHVSQLRELKALAKDAGVPWTKACEMFGISSKTGDLYLRLGDDLGDDLVANMLAIGVPIRALETARQLPEEVRRRLTGGEVIDLEQVDKEQLTQAIRELAQEHEQELGAKERSLAEEKRAKDKAKAEAKELRGDLEAADQQLRDLKAGLPADDPEAMAAIKNMESKIIPMLVVLRYTKMQGRSPEAVSRIIASLSLIEETARWTGNNLAAKAEGDEPDDDRLGRHARMTADEIAASDGQPVPGF